MKYLATTAAAVILTVSTVGFASTGDEQLSFGANTVSGSIGSLPAEGYGQGDTFASAFLTT